jgi:hypothetical protein
MNLTPKINNSLPNTTVVSEPVDIMETDPIDIMETCPTDEPYTPKRFDTLFWCIYISMYGLDKYESEERAAFTVEKNTKFDMIDRIRKNVESIKGVGISPIDVEMTIANKRRIDVPAAIAIARTHGLNIRIDSTNTFVGHIDNTTHPTIRIRTNTGSNKYELMSDQTGECDAKKYEIRDMTKPINGFSSYSLPDLHILADKTGVDSVDLNGKKKTKRVLYDEIKQLILREMR